MDKKKGLPIGFDDFKDLIDSNCYFVDKSLYIKEIIDDSAKVKLITRPRRFGKSLNLSMLRHFFEKTTQDTSYLFKDLQIWQQGQEYTSHQGQYPVLYFSLKDVKYKTFEDCLGAIKSVIGDEFDRHKYIIENDRFDEFKKQQFMGIINKKSTYVDLSDSLKFLTKLLGEYYSKEVIVLIDEYDIPVIMGYRYGYHKDIIDFCDIFFLSGLKGNCNMRTAVLTGRKLYRRVLDIAVERPWSKMA